MAKIEPEWFVESKSGRDGDLVYYPFRGKLCARTYIIPPNPNTAAQREKRTGFSQAVKSWQQLPQAEKDNYNKRVRNLNMSGYNLYISEFMEKEISKKNNPESSQLPAINTIPASGQHRFSLASASHPLRFTFASQSLHRLTFCLKPVQTPETALTSVYNTG